MSFGSGYTFNHHVYRSPLVEAIAVYRSALLEAAASRSPFRICCCMSPSLLKTQHSSRRDPTFFVVGLDRITTPLWLCFWEGVYRVRHKHGRRVPLRHLLHWVAENETAIRRDWSNTTIWSTHFPFSIVSKYWVMSRSSVILSGDIALALSPRSRKPHT